MNKLKIENNPLWYKDGVIYQVHVKAFRDSDGDGIGDFRGLLQKLDYIENLGVNIIWLQPFYPSPLRDDGYDIADYYNVHPDYGTIDDVKDFLKEAHRRGIRVITELVLNHTSDQHPWFIRARNSEPGNPDRDFYVWSNTPEKYKDARIIFQDFEPSNWSWDRVAKAYYWHRFYSHQPDLNFENPVVHKQLIKIMDFWLEAGVDGLRLDAVPYLYEREGTNCENLPETHQFLKKINSHITGKFKNKMLLAEANQWPEDAVAYFGDGDECHMAFHFPLMPRLFMSIQMEDRFPIIDILEQTPPIPDNCQWAMFLRNHDELTLEMVTDEERDYMYRFYAKETRARINLGIRRRLAPLVENNRRKIELLNILLFSFPGTPVIYYGDEIGMGDNYYLGDRNGVRTPMQWSSDRNAGFSESNPQRLFLPVIIDPEYHYESINVEVQQRSSSSLLWWMKRAIAVRKNYKAFGRGNIEFLSPSNPKVISFFRQYEEEIILVVANLSRFSQVVELDLSRYAGYIPMEIFSRNKFPSIKENFYMLTLNPYDYYWFVLLKQADKLPSGEQRVLPEVEMRSTFKRFMDEGEIDVFENSIFPEYVYSHGWSSGDAKINDLKVIDEILLPDAKRYESLFLVKVNYLDQQPELFLIPAYLAEGEEAKRIQIENPVAVIAKINFREEQRVLAEAVYDDDFRKNLLKAVSSKKTIKGKYGELSASFNKRIKEIVSNNGGGVSNLIKAGRINIRLTYFDEINLTLYRKIQEAINPGVEVLKNLSEKTSFNNILPYAGTISYKRENAPLISVGIFTDYVQSQEDMWDYMLDAANKYFDNVSSLGNERIKEYLLAKDLFSAPVLDENSSLIYDLIGRNYLEMTTLLGKRTAEMHIALNSLSNEPGFETEDFSMLYQRSIYQSLRSATKHAMRMLEKNIQNLVEDIKDEAHEVISAEEKILNYAADLLKNKIVTKKIRVHGDFNLKNVLFTGKDFLVINFEGSESSPYSERKLKRSALRDAASMVWSFHFAAYVALIKSKTTRPEEMSLLEPFAEQWWLYMSNSFLKSYFRNTTGEGFLPPDNEETQFLLKIYLLDKALNEMSVKMLDGSEYLPVPIKGLNNIIKHI
ncbi:MAG: maltose alpha-D-glucosyltransferase [Ignavibacteriaceae bacterium]